MIRWVLWLVALGACGRVDFDALRDASTIDAATTLTYRDAVLADQPLGYWRLGDAGAAVHDETGHLDSIFVGPCPQVGGALTGDPNAATQFEQACTFPLGPGFGFEGNAAYAIEIWVKSTPDFTNSQYIVMNETRTGGDMPIDGYALVLTGDGLYDERSIAGNTSLGITVVPPAGFFHVVVNYDGTTHQLFLDAVGTMPVNDPRAMPAYGGVLDIGGFPAFPADFAKGSLDEVAIYDHVLSQSRIALHHDLGVNGPQPL